MTSNEQTSTATAPATSQADQPKVVSGVSTPSAATAAAKTPAKKVARTPAKKAVAPVKAVAQATAAKAAVKPVAKPAAKPAVAVSAKPTAKAPAKTQAKAVTALVAKPKAEKLLKAKKPKLVRDSFTIPKLEYLILEELKHRSGKLGKSSKKSELIRAGIKALAAMSDANFVAALKAVPAIKTGRPAKD